MMQESPKRRWNHLPLNSAYQFAKDHGLKDEAAHIRANPDSSARQKRWMIMELFDGKGLLPDFIDSYWPHGNTEEGANLIQGYWLRLQTYRVSNPGDLEDNDEAEVISGQGFAYEKELRDYLAGHLNNVESGLHLYEDEDGDGVEFTIADGHGRIDILALDADETPVVIELKASRGRNRTLGQILYYMGWVDAHLALGPSRGIIIANDIRDDLLLACKRIPEVSLFQYDLSVTVKRVPND